MFCFSPMVLIKIISTKSIQSNFHIKINQDSQKFTRRMLTCYRPKTLNYVRSFNCTPSRLKLAQHERSECESE